MFRKRLAALMIGFVVTLQTSDLLAQGNLVPALVENAGLIARAINRNPAALSGLPTLLLGNGVSVHQHGTFWMPHEVWVTNARGILGSMDPNFMLGVVGQEQLIAFLGLKGGQLPLKIVEAFLSDLDPTVQFRIAQALKVPGFDLPTIRQTHEDLMLGQLGGGSARVRSPWEAHQMLEREFFIGREGNPRGALFADVPLTDRVVVAAITNPGRRLPVEEGGLTARDLGNVPSPLRELYVEFKSWDGAYLPDAKRTRLTSLLQELKSDETARRLLQSLSNETWSALIDIFGLRVQRLKSICPFAANQFAVMMRKLSPSAQRDAVIATIRLVRRFVAPAVELGRGNRLRFKSNAESAPGDFQLLEALVKALRAAVDSKPVGIAEEAARSSGVDYGWARFSSGNLTDLGIERARLEGCRRMVNSPANAVRQLEEIEGLFPG
jgi:hypothetical protein